MSFKSWKFWLGIVISFIFLYLFLKDIEWNILWQTVKSVRIPFLIGMVIVNISSFLIRAVRWKYFFHSETPPRFHPLFSATAVGFMANAVLPLRLGEIIRAVMLGHKENISKSTCLGTLVVERLFDMLAILFFFAIFIVFYSLPEGSESTHVDYIQEINLAGYTSGLLCLIAVLGLIALRFQRSLTIRIIEWSIRWLPEKIRHKILNITNSFIAGLDVLKSGSSFLISVVLSLVLWLWLIFQTFLLLEAFDLHLGFSHAIFLLVVMAFSVMVPAAPGYVGTFHYGTVIALALMGIEENTASGVAIIGHVLSMFPIVFVGFAYLWRENISLAELQQQKLDQSQYSDEQ